MRIWKSGIWKRRWCKFGNLECLETWGVQIWKSGIWNPGACQSFIEWPIGYHPEYPVVEYLTEDRLCNNCSLWVWDPHKENQEPRKMALQLYTIPPSVVPSTLKNIIVNVGYSLPFVQYLMEYPIDHSIYCPKEYHLEYRVVQYLTETAYVICLLYTVNIHQRLSSKIPFRMLFRVLCKMPYGIPL